MATNIIEDNFIAAIEIGSSKITGMIGRKMADGSIQVKAYMQENASAFMRRGVVYNVDQTSECLKNIKLGLEGAVQRYITKIYVSIGGQSLHSALNKVSRTFDGETKITQEMIDALYEENRQRTEPDYSLTEIIPQDYYDGKQRHSSASSVVGVMADRIEGSFLNIYYRSNFYGMIKDCLNRAGFKNVEYVMTPIVLGETLLSTDARRTGCVLVDIGADTTSVAVYASKLLRRLAVIPLGSNNITKDIASVFKIEEQEAEKLKIEYGSAYSEIENAEDGDESTYRLSDGREVKMHDLNEIVEARTEEILANVEEQVKRSNKTGDDLISGVIVTGGGSNLRDLEKAFKAFSKIGNGKIKFAKTIGSQVNTKFAEVKKADGTFLGILAALMQGKEDCAGEPLKEENIFEEETKPEVKEEPEKNNIDNLNRKEEEPKKPKKPGVLKKIVEGAKRVIDKIVAPDE